MKKFYILSTSDNTWKEKFDLFPSYLIDIFYSLEFAKLCQDTIYKNYKVLCLVAEDDEDLILCPVIIRKFYNENTGLFFYDLTSLYNQGGPIFTNIENKKLQEFFEKNLNIFCKKKKIINYYIRFHPLIKNHEINLSNCQKEITGDFITVNLEKLLPNLEFNFQHRHRKSLKKAINNKIEIVMSNEDKYISEFYKVYSEEMTNKVAEKFYFFPINFFKNIKNYTNKFKFFYAFYEKKMISCELVFFNDFYCHSYLGATVSEYKDLCANHLLKKKIIEYFRGIGVKYYLIGGGSKGILHYKKGFSNEKPRNNIIGLIYYDEKYCNELKKQFNLIETQKLQFYENLI